jgi:thiamine biosynthesis lipoprotein
MILVVNLLVLRARLRFFFRPVIIATLVTLLMAGCSRVGDDKVSTIYGATMGTVYSVKFVDPPPGISDARLQAGIETVLASVNDLMSTYRPDSELSRLNNFPPNKPFAVSPQTMDVLSLSLMLWKDTGGAFDITVGPVVNLWGFGPGEGSGKVPDTEMLKVAISRMGSEKIILEESTDTVVKTGDVHIDLSAVAKGHGVDRVAEFLEAAGITRYLVEIGGELRAGKDKFEGEPWRVAVEKPVTAGRMVQQVLNLRDIAIATSGDYRNFFEAQGERFSHTIDPVTGQPVRHRLASVTVLDPSCARADALATALMVLGPDKALKYAEERGIAAYLLVRSGNGFKASYTPEFKQYMVH